MNCFFLICIDISTIVTGMMIDALELCIQMFCACTTEPSKQKVLFVHNYAS